MRVPGLNILGLAMSVISASTVQFYPFVSRTLNSAGIWVTEYDDPIPVSGSLQPVARDQYLNLGLDFTKTYWRFFATQDMRDITRNKSGDQIVDAQGARFEIESITDWFSVDGWNEAYCVEVAPTP